MNLSRCLRQLQGDIDHKRRKEMKVERTIVALGILCALAAGGCGSDNTAPYEDAPTAKIEVSVDPGVVPTVGKLDPLPDGRIRPLAAVADDEGGVTNFVENELVVSYTDDKELDDFIKRYSGELLLQSDPSEEGLEGLKKIALVRVESSSLPDGNLVDDLVEILNDDQKYGEAGLRFSSDVAKRLVAAACTERIGGLSVSINFVSQPHSIPDSTQEAPKTTGYYDAYQWSYWNQDGLNFGVPESWSLLYYAGRLNTGIKIAIIDGGFKPNDDFPPFQSASVWGGDGLNNPNPNTCTGGASCPWHGTMVTSTAMALPDNMFGAAGTAGPVAQGVLISTSVDAVSASIAMVKAKNRHAKIINTSFGGNVHWALAHFLDWFKDITRDIANSGTMIFASAGNAGEDVDEETCFWGYCWEKRFYFPCENPGVICVGGLNSDGSVDPSSNYGSKSVDIFAPYCTKVGPTSNSGDNIIQDACGTSFSSPFVAGIAALVWSASSNLSSDGVKDVLYRTATIHSGKKHVNAFQAVLSAMGTAFDARITSPQQGAQLDAGIPTTLMAQLNVISSPGGGPVPVDVYWNSSIDGDLGSETVSIERTNPAGYNSAQSSVTASLSPGSHVITITTVATIAQSAGQDIVVTDQESVSVEIINPAPQVRITSPEPDESFCEGQAITFRGQATDQNETLDEEAFSWIASSGTPPFVQVVDLGTGRTVSSAELGRGHWMVTLTVTDSFGTSEQASVEFDVLSSNAPGCTDLPPSAVILSPADGTVVPAMGPDEIGPYYELELHGMASDPEDDNSSLLMEWFSSTDGKLGEGALLPGRGTRIHMTEPHRQDITITFRVTDSDGNVTEDSVVVTLYIIQ